MRLPTPNYLPASFYSEDSGFPAAITTPRSACAFKSTIGGVSNTMDVEKVKSLIQNMLQRLPEDQRISFLQDELAHYGIREPSSESFDFSASVQRVKRPKSKPNNSQRNAARDSASPRSTSGTEPGRDKEGHQCGFCKEMNHIVVCARKNDLKRHMGDFHHVVTEFRCPVPNCTFQTESKRQFSQHIKTDGRHKQVVSNNEIHNHEVTICEPIVFACGFADCAMLFEAPPAGDNGKTFRDYIEHVIKHYDDDKCAEWSYETRIRNLLNQSRMHGISQNVDMSHLRWNWIYSTELRRELITGNITNKEETMHRAFGLGSGNFPRDDMERRPALALRGHPAAARGRDLGRRRQRLRKSQASANGAAQYDYESSYQTHASCPESLAASDMTMRRSADPSLSPAPYAGPVHTTPPTPLGDAMPQVFARGSQEVFMGAEASQLDPRMYPGYPAQRELPSFLMGNPGFMIDTETGYMQPGMSHTKF